MVDDNTREFRLVIQTDMMMQQGLFFSRGDPRSMKCEEKKTVQTRRDINIRGFSVFVATCYS